MCTPPGRRHIPPRRRIDRHRTRDERRVLHTSSGHPHGTFVVEVVRAATRVRIAVYDCGWGGTPPIPTPRPPHPNAPNGRGLAIVAALATEVGFEGSDDIGHVVWADLSTEPTGTDSHRET